LLNPRRGTHQITFIDICTSFAISSESITACASVRANRIGAISISTAIVGAKTLIDIVTNIRRSFIRVAAIITMAAWTWRTLINT